MDFHNAPGAPPTRSTLAGAAAEVAAALEQRDDPSLEPLAHAAHLKLQPQAPAAAAGPLLAARVPDAYGGVAPEAHSVDAQELVRRAGSAGEGKAAVAEGAERGSGGGAGAGAAGMSKGRSAV